MNSEIFNYLCKKDTAAWDLIQYTTYTQWLDEYSS